MPDFPQLPYSLNLVSEREVPGLQLILKVTRDFSELLDALS